MLSFDSIPAALFLRLSSMKSVLELSLVVIIAALAANLFWLVFTPLPAPPGQPAIFVTETTAQGGQRAMNPFASAEGTVGLTEQSYIETPLVETTLDLTLFGTWPDETGGTAFIGDGDAPQKRFRAGDEINAGVRLERVYENWVAISRGGVSEALWIDNRKPAPIAGAAPEASPASELSVADDDYTLADIVAFSIDGFATGALKIVLNPGADAEKFSELGFAPGDILLSLNGGPVDPDYVMSGEIQSDLASGNPIDIIVERDGAPVPLSLQLRPGATGDSLDDES